MAQAAAATSKSSGRDLLKIESEVTSKNQLAIEARDLITKRLFSGVYTHKELVGCGFNPQFVVKQIEKIVQNAISGEKTTSLSVGYSGGEAGESKADEGTKSGRETPQSIVEMRDKYRKGDQLVLMIVHDLVFLKSTYTLVLKEVAQDPWEILEQRLNDCNEAIEGLKQKIGDDSKESAAARADEVTRKIKECQDSVSATKQQIQQNMASDKAATKREIDAVKAESKREIDALKSQITALKTKQDQPPQLGCWQSNGVYGSYYNTWTTVISTPPAGLFALSESNSKITVLKTGIYHIHGTTSPNAGYYNSIYINGSVKTYNYNRGSTVNTGIPFDLTIRMSANHYIQIYNSSFHASGTQYNTLTIEKKN